MSRGVCAAIGVVLGLAACGHGSNRGAGAIHAGVAVVELATEPNWADDVHVRELLERAGVAWERIDCLPKDCALGCLPVRCLVGLQDAASAEATELAVARLRPLVQGDVLSVAAVCESDADADRCTAWPPRPREPSLLPARRVNRPGPDAPFR